MIFTSVSALFKFNSTRDEINTNHSVCMPRIYLLNSC